MLFLDLLSKAERLLSRMPLWVSTIADLLHTRCTEQVSLGELAEASGAHPVTVCRYFHKYFGCTLSEYMRMLKIERVFTLMNIKAFTLTQILYACGFAGQSHFTCTFKQFSGLLPKKYRQLLKTG
jgi:AraC family transcriptional regulator